MFNSYITGQPVNETVYWTGCDTEERFLSNLENSRQREYLKQLNWIGATIEYSFNSGGFRCAEFNENDDGFVTLGCSFTSGVGLHLSQIWPEVLAKKLNQPVWNLGVGGSGMDTAYRLAEYYIPKLRPSKVIILCPEHTRIELWGHGEDLPYQLNYSAGYSDDTSFLGEIFSNIYMRTWLTHDSNPHYHYVRCLYSIAYICQSLDIEFYCYDVNTDLMPIQAENSLDVARDLMHHGPICHKIFADIVYADIMNKKTFKNPFLT